MSLQSEIGRGVYDIVELIANRTAGELLEARANGKFNCDEETVRTIATLVKSSILKQAGSSAEAAANIVTSNDK